MERECNKCIHHTSGMCDSWDCKMQTVEGLVKETRAKAIEEFAEKLKSERVYVDVTNDDMIYGKYCTYIDEIAKELRGE